MANPTEPARASRYDRDTKEWQQRESAKLLGIELMNQRYLWVNNMAFPDNVDYPWKITVATGGTYLQNSTDDNVGGITRLATIADAISRATLIGPQAFNTYSDNVPFYAAMRAKFSGAPGGTSAMGVGNVRGGGLTGLDHSITVGIHNAGSATNWVVAKGKAGVFTYFDTGIAFVLDEQTKLEIWRTSASVFCRINDGAILDATLTGIPDAAGAHGRAGQFVYNVDNAAIRELNTDWYYAATEKQL